LALYSETAILQITSTDCIFTKTLVHLHSLESLCPVIS